MEKQRAIAISDKNWKAMDDAAKKRHMKRPGWIAQAIEEKLKREGVK